MNKIYDGLVAVVERKIEARDYGQTVEDLFVTPDKLFDAASDEIKRLQAELKALRDWRTPPYSESQQAQAPPKPEGETEELELGEPEPQKCQHVGHNWNAVYQCRGCGEIVPEKQAQEMERRECGCLD